jgi:hypothetical protein
MKKIYVTPLNKVRDLSTEEGLLLVTSGMEGKDFESKMGSSDGAADNVDLGREHKGNNRNPSIWDQGW